MYDSEPLQPNPAPRLKNRFTSQVLHQIGIQVVALLSQHGSLQIHKQAIERQLASIAAQIKEYEIILIPRNIFLQLEVRGSGGVSDQLEQVAHIVHEQGYWTPRVRVQNYYRQDVYQLGKSAQRLFDDYTMLARPIEHLQALLGYIIERQQMESETTPQGVFDYLAAISDIALVYNEIDAIVELLEQARHHSWSTRTMEHRGRKNRDYFF